MAPHGTEDHLKVLMSKDCTICPPTVIRILKSTVSLFGWKLTLGDGKAAFLKKLVLILVTVVDDIMAAGPDGSTEKLEKEFRSIFKLGTLKIGLGNFRSFRTNITKFEDFNFE